MRDEQDLAKRIRAIQTAIEELKNTQLVGRDQIVITEYISSEKTVTTSGDEYTQEASCTCYITSQDTLLWATPFVGHCVAEVRHNGVLIDLTDPQRTVYTSRKGNILPAYKADIAYTSAEGETISPETYTVKFHVWTAQGVTLTVL